MQQRRSHLRAKLRVLRPKGGGDEVEEGESRGVMSLMSLGLRAAGGVDHGSKNALIAMSIGKAGWRANDRILYMAHGREEHIMVYIEDWRIIRSLWSVTVTHIHKPRSTRCWRYKQIHILRNRTERVKVCPVPLTLLYAGSRI
jgi:hypothetical protein